MKDIEYLFDKECWVIDFLPYRVKEDSDGRFFEIEEYYLKDKGLFDKFLNIILKLNCYYDICIDDEINSDIDKLKKTNYANILIVNKECLITLDRTDSHLTVYNPDEEMLDLLDKLSGAEGLYMWRGI